MNEQVKISKVELKRILLDAAKEIRIAKSAKSVFSYYFMCNAIGIAAEDVGIDVNLALAEAQKVGFVRQHYYSFIHDKYPNLTKYINKYEMALSWMCMLPAILDGQVREVAKSKKEFLKYLANRL